MKNILLKIINIYQKTPTHWHNVCRFTPTCSAYAVTAIERFGIIKGTVLSAWRILRCNPFCKGGIDNVPEEFSLFKKKRQDGGDNL